MRHPLKIVSCYILLLSSTSCFLFNKKNEVATNDIHIAWESVPRSIDPRFATDANSQYLSDLVNCSLIRFDKTGKVTPSVAKSWEWIQPTRLSLEIQTDIGFSDGSLLDPEDIIATYDFARKNDDSPFKQTFKAIKKVYSKGSKIIFDFVEPDATFLTNLTIGILPKDKASGEIIKEVEESVGCGAFTIASMTMDQIELSTNEHYSLAARPFLDSVYFDIVKDETTRFAKLRNGELDLVQKSISRDKMKKTLSSYKNLAVKQSPGLNTTYIGFNMKDRIVSQQKVREALAYALDRQVIIKHVLAGLATSANSMLPSQNYFNIDEIAIPDQNVDKARKLLKEALGEDLSKVHLKLSTTTDLTRVTIAKTIASQFEQLGVKATVQSLEWGKFKEDVDQGNLQMWLLSWIGFKDPDILRYTFSTESFPPNGGNRGFYSNAALDTLLDNAKKEVDSEKRRKLYKAAQIAIAKEVPYLFLWHEDNFAIYNKKVADFDLYPDGRYSSLEKVRIIR